MKKTIIVLVIIAILVVIALLWGIDIRQVNGPEATENEPNSQITQTETSDWKTYRNEELGFELKIPSSMSVAKEQNDKYNQSVSFQGNNNEEGLSVKIRESDLPIDQYFYLDLIPSSSTFIDSKKALVFEAPNGYCGHGVCSDPFVTFSVKQGNLFYNITFPRSSKSELNDTDRSIIDSFKTINN